MAEQDGQAAIQRVHKAVGNDVVRVLEQDLASADLTTLLVSVATARAARIAPGRLLSTSVRERPTRPAVSDPRIVTALEGAALAAVADNLRGARALAGGAAGDLVCAGGRCAEPDRLHGPGVGGGQRRNERSSS